jgi:hypothetical protein
MEKPSLVLKLKVKLFSAILQLAERVHDHLNGNVNFTSPAVGLPTLQAGINDLSDAIAKWGPAGNRGSHADHLNLEVAAVRMFALLGTLARYCESTARINVPIGEQAAVMATSGFALKKQRTPQGALEMAQNFHRFIAANMKHGGVKLRWVKPLNVITHTNVKCYKVYRSITLDFSTATYLKSPTTTTFTDYPGAGAWFYWVVAHNYVGDGVLSHAVKVQVA